MNLRDERDPHSRLWYQRHSLPPPGTSPLSWSGTIHSAGLLFWDTPVTTNYEISPRSAGDLGIQYAPWLAGGVTSVLEFWKEEYFLK